MKGQKWNNQLIKIYLYILLYAQIYFFESSRKSRCLSDSFLDFWSQNQHKDDFQAVAWKEWEYAKGKCFKKSHLLLQAKPSSAQQVTNSQSQKDSY